MSVNREKYQAIEKELKALGIEEDDLEEKFILASKKGGQKVNKTFSCVYLCHKPSNISVKCEKDRSQQVNRYLARKMLIEKIRASKGEKTAREKKLEKIKKQKKRRKRRQKQEE